MNYCDCVPIPRKLSRNPLGRCKKRRNARAEQELAAERECLDKERAHFANALDALHEGGATEEIAE